MGSLPWKARIYIALLTALSIGAVIFFIPVLGKDLTLGITIFAIASAIAAFDTLSIRRYGVQIEITISNSIKFAVVLLFPIPVAIISIFVGTIIGEIFARRVWFKKLFNISEMTLTWIVVAWIYSVLNNPQVGYFGSFQNVLALIVSSATAFIVNSVLVCLVISIAAHLPFLYVWKQNVKSSIWHESALFTLGAFLAVLWRFDPASIVLAVLPLFIVRDSYKTANHLRNQTRDALRALVQVIDERDHHTMNHSGLVSQYAKLIAETLDLPQEEIDVIVPAALLHDLGKVGMADDILFNPKLLDPQERKSAERHAEIGAMLLTKFPLFEKGAVLVRHHHERYDGKGYPDGLAGETIPLGARIIAVADSYQAMTEDRPYRRALAQDEALERLVASAGTQFDPGVVKAFIRATKGAPSPEPAGATAAQTVKA